MNMSPDAGQFLPRRLSDPLRVLRWTALVAMIVNVAWAIFTVIDLRGRNHNVGFDTELMQFWIACLGVSTTVFIFRILPRRRTNAMYLRSFRRDKATARIRETIQFALGSSFRLSGIRPPRRRIPAFIRWANITAFCLRYSTPRFMNLEAGGDWFARLWRSLADCRCAFLDLLDLTDFVVEEMELVYQCLGPERIMFLGDLSRSPEEWRALVVERLELSPGAASRVGVVTWDRKKRAGWHVLADAVRGFARELPSGVAGPGSEAFRLVEKHLPQSRPSRAIAHMILGVLGFLFTVFVVPFLLRVNRADIEWGGPFLAAAMWAGVAFGAFFLLIY